MCLKIMEKYYTIAGIEFSVSGKSEELYVNEGILADFRSEKEKKGIQFHYGLVEQLSLPEGRCVFKDASHIIYEKEGDFTKYIGSVDCGVQGAYMRVETRGDMANIEILSSQIPDRITPKVVLNALSIERQVITVNGFILHAAYIVRNGKGILFTAPSGTGKSTQADLWNQFRETEIVNGDRAIIRNVDNVFYACGLPYAGSSKYCKNITVPLEAIVYLQQSKETQIRPLKGKEAFCKILEGVSVASWNKDDMENVLTNIEKLLVQIPVYQLECTPDESAIIVLENALKDVNNNGRE